mgnify:CR=1 FL=1
MKLAKFIFVLTLIFIVFAQAGLPQKNDSPVEIKANVLVVDANEQPIDNVNQADIQVFEDDIEQQITFTNCNIRCVRSMHTCHS